MKLLFAALIMGLAVEASADMYSNLASCSAESNGPVKSRTNSTSDTTLRISCSGAGARALYDGIQHYASSQKGPYRTDSNYTRITRFFGGGASVPSQCHQYIQNADGSSTNSHSCSLRMSLSSEITKSDVVDDVSRCISAAQNRLAKFRINGTSDSTVGYSCSGQTARQLWDAVQHYSRQDNPSRLDTNAVAISRYFGEPTARMASQCMNVIQNPDGSSASRFTCFIFVDLSDSVIKAM